MSESQREPAVSRSIPGSFSKAPAQIEKEERARRATEDAVRQAPPPETDATPEKKSDKDERPSVLPQDVVSAYGLLTYDEFKERYAPVYEAVNSGEILATGYVRHLFKIGSKEYEVRSFNSREAEVFDRMFDAARREGESSKVRDIVRCQLALVVSMWGGNKRVIEKKVRLSVANFDAWRKENEVSVNFFEDQQAELVSQVGRVLQDVCLACDYATYEAISNPT